jgi:hypothetical protein
MHGGSKIVTPSLRTLDSASGLKSGTYFSASVHAPVCTLGAALVCVHWTGREAYGRHTMRPAALAYCNTAAQSFASRSSSERPCASMAELWNWLSCVEGLSYSIVVPPSAFS